MLHFVAPEAATARPGDALALTGPEAHHAATVRRLRVDEGVTVGDGRGVWLTGICRAVSPKEVVVGVESRREVAAPVPRLVLVQALAKGDRDELAVQAATELGVDLVIPWQSARSVSRWEGPKREKGRTRWATIVREAAKQAHRAWIPDVLEPATTAQLTTLTAETRMIVLDPEGDERLAVMSLDAQDPRDIVLVVGPEGGIAPEELAALVSAGARRMRLGDAVLRTSTAGPAALALVNARLGRW